MLAWCRWCALAYWWPMSGRVAVCPLPWLSLCLTPTNPPIKPNLPEAISAISNSSPSACMTDLTYTNVLCFYHPFPLLPSSLYLPLLSLTIPLLCSPTRLLVTSLPCYPWLCTTDCVLYQSLTCVLVQHLQAPCSPRPTDPYAVAAAIERKARLLLCLQMPFPVWHRWADDAWQLPLWNRWGGGMGLVSPWSFRNHSNVLIWC